MITRIVKIGNSRGIRIPKILLEQSGLTEEVEIEAKKDQLIIRSKKSVRQGWEEAFRTMAKNNDDQLLDMEDIQKVNNWDTEEWEW